MAELLPAGIVTLVIGAPPDEVGTKPPRVLVVLRLIVWALAEMAPGLPLASRSSTVNAPLVPAIRSSGALTIATWTATDGVTVSGCMDEESRAPSEAVTVGVPALVSL